MTNFLDPIPTWLIMLVSAVLIFAMSEIGFQVGRGKGPTPDGNDPSLLVQTTSFTILALLLGFSFSLALGRFDARRVTFLRESNAISTTFLRADLLDATTADAVRADLRAYVAQRLAFVRSEAKPLQRADADARSAVLQRDMWMLASQAAHRDVRSTMTPLFLATLNDTINLSAEERAVLAAHIPDVVIIWLLLIALIAAAMIGYGYGRQGKRAVIFKAIFATMVALVFGLVLDLDRPQRGIIRINLTPMQIVQQAMEVTPRPSEER
jgi:hypothetical protein